MGIWCRWKYDVQLMTIRAHFSHFQHDHTGPTCLASSSLLVFDVSGMTWGFISLTFALGCCIFGWCLGEDTGVGSLKAMMGVLEGRTLGSVGSGVKLAAILLRVLGDGVANARRGPLGAFGVLKSVNKSHSYWHTCMIILLLHIWRKPILKIYQSYLSAG